MGLDLGTLSAQVSINTSGVTGELNRVRKALQDVEKQTDKLSNKKLNVDANAAGIDKAKSSAQGLSRELDNVNKTGSKTKVSNSLRRSWIRLHSPVAGCVGCSTSWVTLARWWVSARLLVA